GAVVLLPWLQTIISHDGWRAARSTMGLVVLLGIGSLVPFLRCRPEDIGLLADGAAYHDCAPAMYRRVEAVQHALAATDWTLRRAIRTRRFWWIVLAFFCAMFAWYVVQVHQTKYLIEIGFSPLVAAWSLGIVSVVAIPGQIALGALSDRIGREWIWTVA